LDKNLLLFEQNNKKTICISTKSTMVGTMRVMSYEDIVEAQKKRDIKEAEATAGWVDRPQSAVDLHHAKF
jgi:ribonuclease D